MTQQLHEAIRAESKPGLWSSGVKLARSGQVALESKSEAEWVFRVRGGGRPVPRTVVLYPKDLAWECDCDGREDPCEHVCAAAIALQTEGPALATTESRWAHVVYRFTRLADGLGLSRTLEPTLPGLPQVLEGATSLAAVLQTPEGKAHVQVEQHDLACDRLLARPRRGSLPADLLEPLFTALSAARRVLLDGVPVGIAAERLRPRAVVEDQGEAVSVTLALEPHELLGAGAALHSEVLQLLGEVPQASVRTYPPRQFAELTSTVLPELARRYPVEVKSTRLPRVDRSLAPRIQLDLTTFDGGLSVLPTLVYGAPAHVRIDAGRLVYLHGSVPQRDEVAEQRLVHELRDALDLVPGHRTQVGATEVARWAEKLKGWRHGLSGDAGKLLGAEAHLKPRLSLEPFSLDFEVEGRPGEAVAGDTVLRAFQEGVSLVPLMGGGWAPLPQQWLERYAQQVLDLMEARASDGAVSRALAPQVLELAQGLEMPPPPSFTALRPLVAGFAELPAADVPADVQATLRPYQLFGYRWLCFLRDAELGAVLADDMGLGKTLQAIAALPKGSLVVCPTSVLPNWLAELKRFRPAYSVCAYHGPDRELNASADITVTSYALLRIDQAQLAGRSWAALVLDEAQAIKNPESQVAQAAFAIPAKFRLALSGTPVENRLDELWSVMHFANRGLLGGRRAFDERWARPIADGRKGAAEALRARIRPFVLRRLKKDVAPELPPRTEAVLPVALDSRERDVYQTVLAAARQDVAGLLEKGGSVLKALEALLRLRQAACHPALVPGQSAVSSSKARALLEALQSAAADGHKALVFSQWTSLLDLVEPELQKAGLGFVRLDGSTADRAGVTERFQSDDGPPVMLISLKAGGTGLNLTAADHVFLLDPWWNPAVEAQATDRAHRIGQTRPVTVYRLVAQGTVEEKILELQQHKRALFEAAFGDAGAGAGLTKGDLLALLS